MAQGLGIEWTESTWNPITGCTKVSPGCKHCYAERMAERVQAMEQADYVNGFRLTLQPHMLEVPLGWKKPGPERVPWIPLGSPTSVTSAGAPKCHSSSSSGAARTRRGPDDSLRDEHGTRCPRFGERRISGRSQWSRRPDS